VSPDASHDTGNEDPLRTALKRAAVALKDAGPEPEHDVDFVVAPEDAARAE